MTKTLFAILLFINFTALSQKHPIDSLKYIPPAKDWVNDYVNLFSLSEIQSLDSIINDFEKKTTVQIAVATIDSAMMGPIDFEPYSLLMFNTWGVGVKGKNNGILIVIAPDIRRIRIQNGYGIENYLSNSETKDIIDNTIIPHYKNSAFYLGTKKGILCIIKKLEINGYQ